jgi:hypothetical protein
MIPVAAAGCDSGWGQEKFRRLSCQREQVFFDCFLAFNFMMKHERIGLQDWIVFVPDWLRKFEFCFLKIWILFFVLKSGSHCRSNIWLATAAADMRPAPAGADMRPATAAADMRPAPAGAADMRPAAATEVTVDMAASGGCWGGYAAVDCCRYAAGGGGCENPASGGSSPGASSPDAGSGTLRFFVD